MRDSTSMWICIRAENKWPCANAAFLEKIHLALEERFFRCRRAARLSCKIKWPTRPQKLDVLRDAWAGAQTASLVYLSGELPQTERLIIPRKKNTQKSSYAVRVQYAALPYRFNEADVLERFSSSPRAGQSAGLFPEGVADQGLKPPESAAREAYEEAGVRGKIGKKSVGVFTYEKVLDDDGISVPCEVKVFPIFREVSKREHGRKSSSELRDGSNQKKPYR